jgi:hypothetical protein
MPTGHQGSLAREEEMLALARASAMRVVLPRLCYCDFCHVSPKLQQCHHYGIRDILTEHVGPPDQHCAEEFAP